MTSEIEKIAEEYKQKLPFPEPLAQRMKEALLIGASTILEIARDNRVLAASIHMPQSYGEMVRLELLEELFEDEAAK